METISRSRIKRVRTVIAVIGVLLAGYMGIRYWRAEAWTGICPADPGEAWYSVCWYALIWLGFTFAALSVWLNSGKVDR